MQPGDKVEVVLKKGDVLQGSFIPSPDPEILTLKLDSGYNVGVIKANISSTKLLEKNNLQEEKPRAAIKQPSNLPLIVVISTGGTIASKVDYKSGAVTPLFSSEQLLALFPELKQIASIQCVQAFNLLSENFDFCHYNAMAETIKKHAKNVRGIILTHGTDTLHYTSSALSFMLEGLNIPVILVGSQRSSDRGSSDAGSNFLSAAYFITKTDYAGVGICLHAKSDDGTCLILKPHNARKMHSSRRDAFRPINCLPLAEVNFLSGSIKYLSEYSKTGDSQLKVKPFNEKLKVGWIRTRPHIQPEEFKAYERFDGLIIEATGLGHVTMLNPKIKEEIRLLAKRMPIVITTQCIYGRVNLDIYSNGRELQALGVIPNLSGLTSETAYIKLACLLSSNPKANFHEVFNKDIRGETIPRITPDTFLW